MATRSEDVPLDAQRLLELASKDPQLQELMPDPAVAAAIQQPGLPLEKVISTVLDGYAGRPALGEREYQIVLDGSTGRRVREYQPRFATITYYELHNRVKRLAGAWRYHEQHRVAPGEFVCILGFSGIDYVTADLACAYAQAVSVPLQSSLASADISGIFIDIAPVAVVATVDDLVLAGQLAGNHPSVRSVVAIDYDPRDDNDREAYAAAQTELAQTRSSAQLIPLSELIAFSDARPWEPLPPSAEGDERMAQIIHSSGSTGTPKGAIILDRNAKVTWRSSDVSVPVVRVSFAPMNHFLGRIMVYSTLARGGTVFFTTKPDMSMLFDDIRLVRPTELTFFPRVLEMIHRHYQNEVIRRLNSGQDDLDAARAEAKAEMRDSFLGDRLCLMTVGAAPTPPEIKQFMEDCFHAPLHEGYGSTEAGSICRDDRIARPPVIDYRLRDVPELGYSTADKPFPRGELCVKTQLASPGYFKRPDATAKLFDDDGYVLTGDVVEERGPDHIVVIDRRNDVLKLSQGEYVAAGAIGVKFEGGSPVIHQIYVYGNSSRSYLLAVVVPNMAVAERLLGADPSEAQLKELIRSELKKVATAENMKSFEVPRDFIIEKEPFSQANGLLSSVQKRMRPALRRRYGDRLEEMYAELDQKQNDELLALRDRGDLSVVEKVGKALEASLGVQDIDVSQPVGFVDLGGDSLGATAFSALLDDIFGVTLPVNAILSPAGNPTQWAQQIEAGLRADAGERPTFATVHGAGARHINAADLDISAFLDPRILEHPPMAEPPAASTTVLLTGATGFLGRFMCLEWLERLAPINGKLICLVRAGDHNAAAQRLAAAFAGDPELEKRFHTLADGHLEVLVGDVAETRLGLDAAEFDRLSDEVDRIVHVGALVNHMLGYEDLFEPNVLGTAELIALALTRRQKRFDFLSSVATTFLLERNAGDNEDSPLRQEITLTGEYSDGYGVSKWAAEQLLHSTHRRFGLPVNVFRGDMMLAHRYYHQQINVTDVFTRLLYSVIMTGLAPMSFYELAPDGRRQKAHYDGLPVDFVAGSVVGISAEPHREIRTFHVANYHIDDGLSLDTFVDWIQSAGYRVQRVDDHREWINLFEAKLKALPDEQRQHSSLAVLDSLRKPYDAARPLFGSQRYQAAVRRLPIGPEVPHLTEEFIDKCLDDMRRLGLIPEPSKLLPA